MIHKEFKVTITEPIREVTGREVQPIHYHIGQEISLRQDEFDQLKNGETVERFTREGVLRFDKYNFANGVRVIEIEITENELKLGNTRGRKPVIQ
jgi:hypothetical protein